MITVLSESDKKRAGQMYEKGVSLNEIRINLIVGKEVAQKTIRNAVLEYGFGAVLYCPKCGKKKPFVAVVRGGREFCNDCGLYVNEANISTYQAD